MGDEYTKIWNLDPSRAPEVLRLFRQSWWAASRSLEDTRSVLANSNLTLGFSGKTGQLIGFIRVVTDFVYKATIYDVLVDELFRGENMGRALVEALLNHPDLVGIQHIELYCAPEMISFYNKFGFEEIQPSVVLLRKG